MEALLLDCLIFTTYLLISSARIYVIDQVNGPFRSFADVSNAAPNGDWLLQPGDEVIINSGTYRETVELRGHGTAAAPIIVRAADNAVVNIKGSDIVRNWTFVSSTSACTIYNTSVSYNILPNVQVYAWSKQLSPYALLSDMLFVNGESYLQNVYGNLSTAKSFWVAPGTSVREMRICVPSNVAPNTALIEVAVRQRGFYIEWSYYPTLTSDWIFVSGIHVSQVATTNNGDYSRSHGSGIMIRTGTNHRFTNCSSTYNNWDGFDFYGVNVSLTNVVVEHNGNVGVAPGSSGAVLTNCSISYNSWRYGNGDNCGGVKMCGGGDSQHSASFIRCSFIGNLGPGIWFDTVGGGHLIDQCYFQANQNIGVLFEAISNSYGSSTVRNSIFAWQPGLDSGQDYVVSGSGVHLYNAANIYIYQNTFYNNYHAGVVLMGGDARNGGITQGCNIFNNIFVANESLSLPGSTGPPIPHSSVGVYMWTWGASLLQNRTHYIDHNVYYKPPGSSANVMVTQYNAFYSPVSLSQLQTLTKGLFDSHSLQQNPLFLSPSYSQQQTWAQAIRQPYLIADNSPAVQLGVVRLASDQSADFLQRSRRHLAQDAGATLSAATASSALLLPSSQPSSSPSLRPSASPSFLPTARPSSSPTSKPSFSSTSTPSTLPTSKPTSSPTTFPTTVPTSKPSSFPTCKPSSSPTSFPTNFPTSVPTIKPTNFPTSSPTNKPYSCPTNFPIKAPTIAPSSQLPTAQISPKQGSVPIPSKKPSVFPTSPSFRPSAKPTLAPTTGRPRSPYPSLSPTLHRTASH